MKKAKEKLKELFRGKLFVIYVVRSVEQICWGAISDELFCNRMSLLF